MSETKRYGSIESLCQKILSEAEQYENELLEKARADADAVLREYEKKAIDAKNAILDRAEQKAKAELAAAESAREMRAKSARLAVKSELLTMAYRAAEDKIAALSAQAFSALFVPYLEEVLTQKPQGTARLYVGKGSPVKAEDLLAAAGGRNDVVPSGEKESFVGGFCLETDEISFDCSAHALIESIRSETESDVARLLFAEE